MKSKFLVLLLLIAVVFAGFSLAQAATSQIDNMPGGAGFVYWQTNASWRTLINIQNTHNTSPFWVDIILFDENSVHLADWQMPLTPNDNTGVIISSPADGTIRIEPYSVPATFLGTTPAIGINMNGQNVSGIRVGTDGFMKGYMSVVLRSTLVPVTSNQPTMELPDVMFIRAAYMNAVSAFAMNGPMFQGFVNIGTDNGASGVVNEANTLQWLDTNLRPNRPTICNADGNGTLFSSFGRQDASRAAIGFMETMLTDNVFIPFGTPVGNNPGRYRILCPLGQVTLPALGSSNGNYWARYNATNNGISSSLVLISPASSSGLETTPQVGQQVAAPNFRRHIDANAYDDAENPLSSILDFPEVARIPFGNRAGTDIVINSEAGEARLIISAPVFGFSYTEGGGFVDAYPIVSTAKNIYQSNMVYGYNLGRAIDASANAPLQLVTDYGFSWLTGAYFGPWEDQVNGTSAGVCRPNAGNTLPLDATCPAGQQRVYNTGWVFGATTFGVEPENVVNAALVFDNYTPKNPEVGTVGNVHSTELSGYKVPTTPLCGWEEIKSADVASSCVALAVVSTSGRYYVDLCSGICVQK
ncbi:secreted protein [Candidatus Magnetobacterium bavaricum]|uniref:Secreted protein n=1 Tax=Candidatus Magnetobacterium bavaricum TaxID=29290 RepID=A0A0F3GZS7_9BACT|nr:secreted protein [Candidatus Magnetobacterium bavaricum]